MKQWLNMEPRPWSEARKSGAKRLAWVYAGSAAIVTVLWFWPGTQ